MPLDCISVVRVLRTAIGQKYAILDLFAVNGGYKGNKDIRPGKTEFNANVIPLKASHYLLHHNPAMVKINANSNVRLVSPVVDDSVSAFYQDMK